MRCRLQTPDAVPPNTILAVGATYAVRAGDTLAGLTRRFAAPAAAIAALNPDVD